MWSRRGGRLRRFGVPLGGQLQVLLDSLSRRPRTADSQLSKVRPCTCPSGRSRRCPCPTSTQALSPASPAARAIRHCAGGSAVRIAFACASSTTSRWERPSWHANKRRRCRNDTIRCKHPHSVIIFYNGRYGLQTQDLEIAFGWKDCQR